MDFNLFYKNFIDYKVSHLNTYGNLIKKVKNIEDLKYAYGLMYFGVTKILFKPKIDNETVRGR
jgi:hypothetical protein